MTLDTFFIVAGYVSLIAAFGWLGLLFTFGHLALMALATHRIRQ